MHTPAFATPDRAAHSLDNLDTREDLPRFEPRAHHVRPPADPHRNPHQPTAREAAQRKLDYPGPGSGPGSPVSRRGSDQDQDQDHDEAAEGHQALFAQPLHPVDFNRTIDFSQVRRMSAAADAAQARKTTSEVNFGQLLQSSAQKTQALQNLMGRKGVGPSEVEQWMARLLAQKKAAARPQQSASARAITLRPASFHGSQRQSPVHMEQDSRDSSPQRPTYDSAGGSGDGEGSSDTSPYGSPGREAIHAHHGGGYADHEHQHARAAPPTPLRNEQQYGGAYAAAQPLAVPHPHAMAYDEGERGRERERSPPGPGHAHQQHHHHSPQHQAARDTHPQDNWHQVPHTPSRRGHTRSRSMGHQQVADMQIVGYGGQQQQQYGVPYSEQPFLGTTDV